MSTADEIIQRWKANTGSLGIRLTDDVIERHNASGLMERLSTLDEIFQRTGTRDVVPDYLADTREHGEDSE
jgi:hypothetical protein